MTQMLPTGAYRRVLLKLSGESLMGAGTYGIDRATIGRIVREIAEIARLGVELAIVIGGGIGMVSALMG